jgi:hypothetical protein
LLIRACLEAERHESHFGQCERFLADTRAKLALIAAAAA